MSEAKEAISTEPHVPFAQIDAFETQSLCTHTVFTATNGANTFSYAHMIYLEFKVRCSLLHSEKRSVSRRAKILRRL
jgi:hypothetical protein